MKVNAEKILEQITDYYLSSPDYNGMPSELIEGIDENDLIELIEGGKICILTHNDDINVYINRLNLFKSSEMQVDAIRKKIGFVAYPTPKHLHSIEITEEKPFTKMLATGIEQFRILFFSVDILELYANNPQYQLLDFGYGGSITITDECYEDNDQIHSEYIKNFGIAYPTDKPIDSDRAVAVFLHDLAKLNTKAQSKWNGFLLEKQNSFRVNGDFIKCLLIGEWIDSYWIFDALLDLIKYLNDMCRAIGIPPLFRKEYSRQEQELIGYRIILIPTMKNYYEFVSALEKIVINNLNFDTFQVNAKGIKGIERKNADGSPKGSISMFAEWLNKNYCHSNQELQKHLKEEVFGVFKKVRTIRQVPAHELYSNTHNKALYQQQNELIEEMYNALEILCFIFQRHPSAAKIQAPVCYLEKENVVLY